MIPTMWSLFFDCEALPADVEKKIEQSPALEALRQGLQGEVDPTFWTSAGLAIGDGLRQMMSVSVSDVLLRSWATHPALKKKLSLDGDPDSILLFDLGEHEITSRHHPEIEVRSEARSLGSLIFDLDLTLSFQFVRLQLQGGRVIRAAIGACGGEGRLGLGDAELASFRKWEIPIPEQVSFGAGVPIEEPLPVEVR